MAQRADPTRLVAAQHEGPRQRLLSVGILAERSARGLLRPPPEHRTFHN
jgi:hypothetical protein